MTPTAVAERAGQVAAVRADSGSGPEQIKSALVATRQIRAWTDAQEAGLISQLGAIESFCEPTIADAGKCSLGHANKSRERSQTLADARRDTAPG